MQHQPSTLERGDQGTGPQDQILIQAALSGRRDSVDTVMQRLSCVVRFVYRLNRSMGYHMPTEGLEDVVQQVFLALWPRLPEFAGTSALETWVYGFCRNCLRAEFRRRTSRQRPVQNDESLREQVTQTPPPEEIAVQMESLDLLHEELEQLPDDDREIVELRHLQGLSFEQIARQKHLPPSTIKDRCYKAVDKIRMRLKRRHGRA